MNHDEIDRILADDEQIVPSSGFLASVMDAVETEAALPPPLAFPWLRALPGLLALVAALTAATWQGMSLLTNPAEIDALTTQLGQLTSFESSPDLPWVALALAVTVTSLSLPLSLLRSRTSL